MSLSRLHIERDPSKPSEFQLLTQLVEELDKDLSSSNKLNFKKALKDELGRQNLSTSLLEHLKDERELKSFIDAFKDARNLQICFLIDVTGSIAKYYDNFKNQVLTAILDAVLSDVNKGSKRYAYIGYRERNEDYEFHQFTENIDEIREAIRNTKPEGGGDTAEDVEFALDLFVKKILFNRKGTRLIIHVADAPCHGKRYHESNIDDSHPEWSDNIPDLLANINNNFGCFYWFVKITKHTDKMITEFNKILAEKAGDDPNAMSIQQIDLHKLRGNLKDFFENMFHETIVACTINKHNR